jgi:hypothetical protein
MNSHNHKFKERRQIFFPTFRQTYVFGNVMLTKDAAVTTCNQHHDATDHEKSESAVNHPVGHCGRLLQRPSPRTLIINWQLLIQIGTKTRLRLVRESGIIQIVN